MEKLVAEPFVSFVVERLGYLLIQESNFLGVVRGQVQQTQTELNRMQCFLKDADAKREEGDELVRNWVAEIREVAYDAEDLIETFVIKVAFRRRRSSGILNVLMRYSRVFKDHIALHKVGLEIKSIKTKISSITTSLQTYGIRPIREGESLNSRYERLRQLRHSYPHDIIEEDIVGLEEDVNTLVKHLVNEEAHGRVSSIWGMGGLGKTTLAKLVYNHSDVRRYFDCVSWAYVSRQCNTREVWEGILIKLISPSKEEREEIEKLKPDELAEKLHRVQSEKKCLVILDDFWENEDWDSLSPGFPRTNVGSKILLTTRKKEVALHVDRQCFLHELRHLTEDQSWELYEKKTSLTRREEFKVSTEMELGKEMVKHCGGLPLAIMVIGGLLGTKHTLGEWETVHKNISYYLSKGKGYERVIDFLALSYQDLPYHLKACFLYLDHLPKDCDIRAEKLVQKWMAEGIVMSIREEETMLDVGMSFLGELVQRSMVQVQFTRFSRRVKVCHLHDLVRDLCLLKAQEESFFKVVRLEAFDHQLWVDFASSSLSSVSPSSKIRRLVVYYLGERDINGTRRGCMNPLHGNEIKNHRHIRACQLYFFGNNLDGSSWRQMKSLFKGFKLLRDLDLEGIKISGEKKKLPTTIGSLIHLRYLSIRDSNIEELPFSIANLAFLQTLDLRVSDIARIRIPNVLWRLEQLRHLYLPFDTKWTGKSMLRLDGLSNLETLKRFNAYYFDVRCFFELTNLRKLEVDSIYLKELAVILKSPILSNSNRLLQYSSFKIVGDFITKEEQSLLRQVLGFHHLHKLELWGSLNNLVKLPDQFPPNLTKLTLYESKLEEDPMPILEKFPNLRSLTLEDAAYIGKEMVCSAPTPTPTPTSPSGSGGGGYGCRGGFPQLKFLCLYKIQNLEEWRVEEGAMLSLSHLEIIVCRELKEIPEGLRFITTLRELKIIWPSNALRDRVREGGEDFYKVRHVPSIKIVNPYYGI